jgi:hypothetical protein
MRPLLLAGRHPERGLLYAAADATARYTEPQVRPTRLGAMLAPFPTEEAARAALDAAGAHEVGNG